MSKEKIDMGLHYLTWERSALDLVIDFHNFGTTIIDGLRWPREGVYRRKMTNLPSDPEELELFFEAIKERFGSFIPVLCVRLENSCIVVEPDSTSARAPRSTTF